MAEITNFDGGTTGKADRQVMHFLEEISAAIKRDSDYRKEGARILDIYNGKAKDKIPFNILYSNTETMLPALYNNTPRPVVQRRFKDEDPIGKASAQAGQRTLEFLVDSNTEEYQPYDDAVTEAVLDALLPGQGATRVKYDADVVEVKGKPSFVSYETVCFESIKWNRWVHGFAKKWTQVPWVAYEFEVGKKEAEELFGAEIANKLTYTKPSPDKDETKPDEDQTNEDLQTCRIFEIWDKDGGKKVRFVSPTYTEGFLKIEDDPLELTGFFPMPRPLKFLRKANDLTVTALYCLYENQAKELNRITVRINKIVDALKVRGVYDSAVGEIEQVLMQADNKLIPAQNNSAMEKGLDHLIWLMPIEKLIVVVQQLYIARENCKKVIYEITGISDILRGSSVASETATAQEIKQQWGTLRIKRLQKEVQRYTRDLLRIALEIAAKRFSERTFAAMTGLPFASTMEVQQAQMLTAAAQQVQQQPPPAAVATLQKPQWEAVMKMLRDKTQRSYRIDIETNSTIDVEATEDQKLMTEAFAAIGQFIQGVTPMIVSGAMPFQAAQAMLLTMVRRYRFGVEIEDYIKAMQPPKSPDEGKQKETQAKMQMEQEKHKADLAKTQMEMQAREKELALEAEFKQKEHQLKMAEMEAKAQLAQILAQIKMAEARAKLQAAEEMARIKVAEAHAMPKDTKKEPSNAAS